MKRSLGAKTLAYPVPVWLIATYGDDGRANAMTASWAGICCSKPPCIGVSLRKATYTYGSLVARRAFTVNVPPVSLAAETDYLGAASGRQEDKLAKLGLTVTRSEVVDAPILDACPLVLECRLLHDLEIGLHTLFVGEILDVKADEAVLGANGLPELDRIRPFVYSPEARTYHAIGELLGHAGALGARFR